MAHLIQRGHRESGSVEHYTHDLQTVLKTGYGKLMSSYRLLVNPQLEADRQFLNEACYTFDISKLTFCL
jgi:hypothetical protein